MRYLIPSVVVVAIITVACVGSEADPPSDPPGPNTTLPANDAEEILVELEEQREIWMEQGASDYVMALEIGCFCPPEQQGPFEVTIADGDVVDVTMRGGNADPSDRDFLTVEGMFSTIEEHADSDEINVTYSPDGYPTSIEVDPSHEIVDEEFSIDVLSLTPLSR